MNKMTQRNRKNYSTLAKAAASENVSVVFDPNADTASFDMKNRQVRMPIFQGVSDAINNMFIFHEIAHARYTPEDYCAEEFKKDYPDHNLGYTNAAYNIIEDIRIEKMIKRKFPGARQDFHNGYEALVKEHNFFETSGKDLTEYSFIDRINLHFKYGITGIETKFVGFSESELDYINNFLTSLETWDDVKAAVKEYFDKWFDADLENFKKQPCKSKDGNSVTSPGGMADKIEGEEFSGTVAAGNRSSKKLSGIGGSEYYLQYPDSNGVMDIVSSTKFYQDIQHMFNFRKMKDESSGAYWNFMAANKTLISRAVVKFQAQMSSIGFNKKVSVNSGAIDIKKLAFYQTEDDVFTKKTIDSSGQNHGVVVFLDWSVSMTGIMLPTFQKIFFMWEFCKKMNIPYDVYFFRDWGMSENLKIPKDTFNSFNVPTCDKPSFLDIQLVHILDSKMSRERVRNLGDIFLDEDNSHRVYIKGEYSLRGTPLDPCIIKAIDVVNANRKLKGIDILTTIFLTDGGNTSQLWLDVDDVIVPIASHDSTLVFFDPKTASQRRVPVSMSGTTTAFLEHLKIKTGSNVIGYRFDSSGGAEWKMNGCEEIKDLGYDKFTSIDASAWTSGDRRVKNIIVDDFVNMMSRNYKEEG